MPKCEEPPAVGLGKPLTVLHSYIDAVVHTVEVSAAGLLCTRATRKCGVKDPGEFFYNDRAFGKRPCLQIRIDVTRDDIRGNSRVHC